MVKGRGFVLTAVALLLTLPTVLLILSLYFYSFEVSATPAIGSTTITLYPITDTYVNSSSPETNYGTADSLYVSANPEQDFTYAYVKFDLTSLPPSTNIISAKLKLYLSDTGGLIDWSPADTIGAYYCSNNSWTEIGITWNNRPSFNPIPTSSWSFGSVIWVNEYKSWNVTVDVKTALASGTLTEVVKFENKSWGEGYALFRSGEGTSKPELEVEYSTQPIFTVNLESVQDTGATNNLGLTTLAGSVFSLPSSVDVVAGSYQALYSGGYNFVEWQTSGGITVSNTDAATTTVTVSGNGTLRAVGNVEQLEYSYDRENATAELVNYGDMDAVRFTPLFSNQLLKARFYIYNISSLSPSAFNVYVMDQNRQNMIPPFKQTPSAEGWFDVDLSSYGINVNVGTDFYIGMYCTSAFNPVLGKDSTQPTSERSWFWNGENWKMITDADFMIRAVIGTMPQPAPSPKPTPTPSPSPTATPSPSPSPSPTPSTEGLSLPREVIYAAVVAIIIPIVVVTAVVLKKRQSRIGKAPTPPSPPPPPAKAEAPEQLETPTLIPTNHVFISHVVEDADIASEIARSLEKAGYKTWYYERDSVVGFSYLLQTMRAIEQSQAVVLLISPDSLSSNQVTKEVIRTHEAGKPFIPLLHGISHVEFQQRQPEWREAIGSATSISIPKQGISAIMPRIIKGLAYLGVKKSGEFKEKPA